MKEIFSRTEMLLGSEALDILKRSRVCVFGIGGVGGFCAEALARSGVGTLDIVDSDTVSMSNMNRQIYALHSTVGMSKVDAAEIRMKDIDPEITVNKHCLFYSPENEGDFDFSQYDYVVDAVDTVSAKISIALRAKEAGVPVISSMGAGNKLDPCAFEVTDLYKTSVCPLAKVMRRELKKRGVEKLKVVYSREEPVTRGGGEGRKRIPASCAFVPSVVGLIIAGEVIKDLTGISRR